MKKILLILFVTFVSMDNFAQRLNQVAENFVNDSRNIILNSSKITAAENISGSPYTTPDFVLGKVTGYDQNYLLRYDAFHDQMQVKDENDKIVIINKETINEVTFNNGKKYLVFDYTIDGDNKNGYLEILYSDSKISLLKKEVIKFIPAQEAQSSYETDKPAAYKKGSDIYLVSNKDGNINSFSKKKDFLKFFPQQKKDIEKYIKANKIKFSKEQDLIKLVKYVNASQ